ncbi:MAG: InlB B-repeat-containing protein [Bacilli bacterium]|nr:InlB B-repeat-containing protein [Bacilli bacterium]
MKKIFIVVLLFFVIGLYGCSNKNASAAEEVDGLIDLIAETVTLDSETAIEAARTAYDALTDAQKALVAKYADLEAAELALATLVNQAAANPVIALIEALPATVTLDDEDDIVAARAAYDALTTAQKSIVGTTLRNKLENAETDLADLKTAANNEQIANQAAADAVEDLIEALPSTIVLSDQATVEAARAAYDALTADQKALVTTTNFDALVAAEAALAVLVDEAAADAVEALIAALPSTLTIEDQADVVAARTAYTTLTIAQQALVATASLDALVAAEADIQELVDQAAADAVETLIAALPSTLTLEDQADVVAARAAYTALTTAQKALVDSTSLDALVAAEADIQALLDEAAADAVETLIAALPAVAELTYQDEADVEAARAAYDALTTAQQALVATASLDALEAAEAEMVDVMAQYAIDLAAANVVVDLITALPVPVTLDDETDVDDAETAYNGLTADQKDLVSNYAVLQEAISRIEKLNDPDYQVIFEAIEELGSQVTDDVVLPSTVTWSLKAGEDDTVFDVATGQLLKNVFAVQEVVLIATSKTDPLKFEEVTINFGMLAEGETGLFYHDLSTYVNETHWNGWTMTKTYTAGDVTKTDVLFHINAVVVVSGQSGTVDSSVLTTAASTSWSSAGSAILNDGPESISFALNQAAGPSGFRLAVVVTATGTIKGTYTDANQVVTLEDGEFVWLARFLDANPSFNLSLETNFSTTSFMSLQKIQIPTYTVRLNIDGDTSQTFSVKEGATFAQPTDPVKAGFTFDGWYTNSGFTGSAVVFPYTVTGGVTLYAKFTANPA